MQDQPFLRLVQGFLANSISISTVRRMGPSGTLQAARKFLKDVNLRDLGRASPSAYERHLDTLTGSLQDALPSPAHWGVARKCLNLFLRDALYNFYLRSEFDLAKFERNLEIPLDSHVGKALAVTPEGRDLPAWRSVVGLDSQLNSQFQQVAASVAKRKGTYRVHLDLAYWRGQPLGPEPKPRR